jgi:DNA-binding transcriptional ArsR family regulator
MLELSDGELDRLFQALSNAGRRRMVDRLCRGPASLGELAEPLEMTLSAVEQHLRALERSGLVRSEKRGRVRYCRLEPAAMDAAQAWIAERRELWVRRLDALGEQLDADASPEGATP